MTRPRKMKVLWFPHACNHGKTMFVMEKKYGLKGYVFWFKLLEILGDTEGHFVDLNDPATNEFVQVYTSGNSDTNEMLNTLAALDAIDREAWGVKIIWSANFVKGVAQTYLNRRVEPPPRPDNYIQELLSGGIPTCNLQPIIREGRKEGIEGMNGRKEGGVGEGNQKISPTPPSTPPVNVSGKKTKKLETLLPDDFGISDQVRTWAEKNGFARLEEHLESFRDYAQSRGKKYIDWDAAFRRAIREDWGKIRGGIPNEPKPTPKHDKSCICKGMGVVFSHTGLQGEPVYRKCRGKDEPKDQPPAA